ncbi:hypothetical protein ACIA49_39030 [Kribbella sp. NPDC051587]|uniref:hypothetical protein n=1 Tax=Kribbella sp. NPDC051587 TaxID=3364119 RepID=UPI0037A86932
MHRSSFPKRLVIGLSATLLFVLAGTTVAAADQPDPAKQKAATAVANKICAGKLAAILKPVHLDDDCIKKIETIYADGTDGITAKRVCESVLPGKILAIPRAQCQLSLGPVIPLMVQQWKTAYDAAKAVKTGIEIAKFVANPSDGIDDLANQTKQAGVSLAQVMATDLVQSTPSFDATQGWWGAKYRQALVLGFALLAGMTLLAIRDAAKRQGDEELVSTIFLRLPVAVLAMCFAPAIGLAITKASNGIALAAVPTFNGDLDKFLTRITDMSATSSAAGSPLLGILLFGLLFCGVALTICALLLHTLALYLTGVAMAIVWGMYVNPRWRPQVNRTVAFWISTAFAKPLLVFMLGVAFAVAGNLQAGVGSLQEILNIALVGLTILLVGLTPMALLKFIPMLPASTESMRPATGGSILGAGTSAAASVAMSRGSWGAQREKSMSTSKQTSTQTTSNSSTSGGQSGPGQMGGRGAAGQNRPDGQTPQQGSTGPNTSGTGGPNPPTDPGQATKPATQAGGKIASGGAVAAGTAVGGPVGAAAAAALAAAAKATGEKARQTAAGAAPDIHRQDGGERS